MLLSERGLLATILVVAFAARAITTGRPRSFGSLMLVFSGDPRFRLPIEPLLLILAAVGVAPSSFAAIQVNDR